DSIVIFHDHAALYQNPRSLECALAFEGSDRSDVSDWVYDADIYATDFCGQREVHNGFAEKLRAMLRSQDYDEAIRSKLPFCSELLVTGHSMGGAQAELFSACANNGRASARAKASSDYGLVAVGLQSPKLLRPFLQQVPGVFLQNHFSGLCLDVAGHIQTLAGSSVVAAPCHDTHQRWSPQEDRVVNQETGHCLTAQKKGAIQAPCVLHAQNQSWNHTEQGLLISRSEDMCLNADLKWYRCPFTDQTWDLRADGHLVNRLSGRCMDVAGASAVEGTFIFLRDCIPGKAGSLSQQRWQLTHGLVRSMGSRSCTLVRTGEYGSLDLVIAHCGDKEDLKWDLNRGFLRHRASAMCANVPGEPGFASGSYLNLAPCETKDIETPGLWKLTSDGFMLNVGNDWLQMNKCLSAKVGKPTELSLDICDFATDQSWLLEDGLIRSTVGGKHCVSLAKGALRLSECNAAGHFDLEGDLLRSRSTGKCLSAAETEPGLQVCDPQNLAQRWRQK
ncbi:unnamed protein product, partial [Effrenium voratum]